MAVTHKISSSVPRSTMSSVAMPVSKRVRIERWCADVAKHMRAGSLCRSVIGHVLEEQPVHPDISTEAAFPGPEHPANTTPDRPDLQLTALPTKTSSQLTPRETSTTPVAGRRLPSAPATLCFSFGLRTPVHSQYLDQRRKVDRLVQGLPVQALTRSPRGRSAAPGRDERFLGTSEEVVQAGEVASLPSRQQRSAGDQPGAARPRPTSRPSCRATPADASRLVGRSASPAALPARSSVQQGAVSGHGLVTASDVTVIEDDVRRWHGNTPCCARGLLRTGASSAIPGKALAGQAARQRLSASPWKLVTQQVRHSASPCDTTSP